MTDGTVDGPPEAGSARDSDPALARVGAATGRLADIASAPLAEHAAAYQEISGELQAALAEIDGA